MLEMEEELVGLARRLEGKSQKLQSEVRRPALTAF
jgi:hypothetical protein